MKDSNCFTTNLSMTFASKLNAVTHHLIGATIKLTVRDEDREAARAAGREMAERLRPRAAARAWR